MSRASPTYQLARPGPFADERKTLRELERCEKELAKNLNLMFAGPPANEWVRKVDDPQPSRLTEDITPEVAIAGVEALHMRSLTDIDVLRPLTSASHPDATVRAKRLWAMYDGPYASN